MKRELKTLGLVLLVIIVVTASIILNAYIIAKSKGIGIEGIADFDKKVNIWSTVPGNSTKNKLEDMNIDYNEDNVLLATVSFSKAIANKEYEDVEEVVDTLSYLHEIKGGCEKETYEDEPYIIPYLVDNSDLAVIVVPGGGFGYKSINGATNEGKDIAETLNRNGVNAFILYYRTNPYEYPIPYLDLQRAIRYIRYHSEDYHIDKEKISLIGFSAGGNEIGTFINIIQGMDFLPNDYIKDEIDKEQDYVNSVAMIYPALSFRANIPMLFCMFDAEDIRDENKREQLLEQTDLYKHIKSENVRQFVAYGTNDIMVGMEETKKYINCAKEKGINVEVVEAKNQEHGFKQKYYMKQYLRWLKGGE